MKASALSSVSTNYEAIQATLEQVAEEHRRDEIAAKASGALGMMTNFQTFFGLQAAMKIFSCTDNAARQLHGKDVTATEASSTVKSLVCYLSQL